MEQENMTVLNPDEETACASVDCEELAVCNCENNETVTPYECATEEEMLEWADDEAEKESKKAFFARKCKEVKNACQSTASRLVKDWKETNGNPYIKQTCITQVDIYRKPDDESPIDTFRTEHVKSYSARSLAVLGAAALIVSCTVDCIVKKILK